MPHSEDPGSSPPVPTPTSEEFEQMDHDAPVKTEAQDETIGDITMADVQPLPAAEEPSKEVKLEDLFADVDSDDEFQDSKKTTQSSILPTSSPGVASSPAQEYALPLATPR